MTSGRTDDPEEDGIPIPCVNPSDSKGDVDLPKEGVEGSVPVPLKVRPGFEEYVQGLNPGGRARALMMPNGQEVPNHRNSELATDNPPEDCQGNLCTGQVVLGSTYGICPLDREGCPWQEAREGNMRRRLLTELGIGKRYHHAQLSSIPHVTARLAIEDYTANILQRINQGTGLLLAGGVGTGKTSIMALIAYAARRVGVDGVAYFYAGHLFDALHHDDGEVRRHAEESPLLLLDDFGTEYVTDWTGTRFDALMESRYAHCRATVVSTNVSPEDLRSNERLTRVVDRWAQMCPGVSTGSESMRGEQE